jgi:ferredoxin-type protein NapH
MDTYPVRRHYGEPPTPPGPGLSKAQWAAAAVIAAGALLLVAAFLGAPLGVSWVGPAVTFSLLSGGGAAWFWLRYRGTTPGIKHDGVFFGSATGRGALGWGLGIVFVGFYVLLYWFPAYIEGGVRLVDPVATALSGADADRWFLYGFLYSVVMVVFGVRMTMKYRHSRYHIVRTTSVVCFQLGVAFLLPYLLKSLNEPEFYFSYFWPLKPEYLFPDGVRGIAGSAGRLGAFMVTWGAMMSFVAVPVLTYFFGKRWYCSWVCGCGGLAETLGDPWRQLSSKSLHAWRLERWMIHSVLVLIVVLTALLWINDAGRGTLFGGFTYGFKRWYGFFIGLIFAGVAGVGFYPLLGSRIWCRYGCPLAAILGLIQRFFSRFQITVNGGQCMSCGNCSVYCEMGIDVRSYAQRGENVVRASCVGCGVCAAVCPRGVLKLENAASHKRRYPGADRPVAAFLESLGLRRRSRGRGYYWS